MRQRQQKIVEHVNKVGIASFDELGKIFDVSPFTIRRDVDYLDKSRLLVRIKGGAQRTETPARFREALLPNRMKINPAQKERIADKAMRFIQPGDSIFLDGSSTISWLARNLAKLDLEITVVTNSVLISLELAQTKKIRLIGLGGVFDPETYSYVGFYPDSYEDSFRINKAFFSCTGLVTGEGTYENAAFNGQIKRFAAQRADEVYLLMDSAKIGKKALNRVLRTNQLNVLITDKPLNEKDYSTLIAEGVKIIIGDKEK